MSVDPNLPTDVTTIFVLHIKVTILIILHMKVTTVYVLHIKVTVLIVLHMKVTTIFVLHIKVTASMICATHRASRRTLVQNSVDPFLVHIDGIDWV